MSNFSEGNSFEEILSRCLARVDNSLDKRQGSIIYDAIAPACAELAQCYIALDVYQDQTYLLTAAGVNLDNKALDYGVSRIQATTSQRLIKVYNVDNEPMEIEIGTRFSIPNELGGYNYTVTQATSTLGEYIAECETLGDVGNDYTGELLPLVSVNNLGRAVLADILKPGEDTESDTSLRERILVKINQEAFAGNKAAYKKFVKELDGVEKTKIFPVWNGGGTVKVAIVASDNTIPSTEFIEAVQELIDPIPNHGEGLGIAPIGHTVTVVAPDTLNINISATLTIDSDYTLEQIESSIEEHIAEYIEEVQEKWEDKDTLTIYVSKVIAAILEVTQVENVSDLEINSSPDDLIVNITGTNVQFPILNEVILNES